jgi:hypothetical protein
MRPPTTVRCVLPPRDSFSCAYINQNAFPMNIPIQKLLHERNVQMAQSIIDMPLKDKRLCCAEVRRSLEADVNKSNVLLPAYGMTVGEFCVIQVLSQDSKKLFKEQLHALAKV